jgi:hypothetical protein
MRITGMTRKTTRTPATSGSRWGYGIYLIRITYPDGTAYVTWATSNPGGGFTVHLAC